MNAKKVGLAALAVAALSAPLFSQAGAVSHDRTFWRAVAANKYAVPPGESVPAMVAELSSYLASPDPELRDDIAYSTLAAWIYRQKVVPIELRRSLLGEWTANLTVGIGERASDSVFRRSFSALALGILVITDNETPYLEKAEFDRVMAAATAYLSAERDTRGFDPAKGWIHSVAHTADLLKFLARSRHLQPAQQAVVLKAIGDRMASLDGVLTHGEDERLARAVLSIAARPDFAEAAFRAWVPTLAPPRATGPPTPASLASAQNRRNLAVAIFTVLSTDTRNLATIQTAREIVLATLRTMM